MKKKLVLTGIVLLCIVGLSIGAAYLKSVADYKQMVKEITFGEISLSDIPDGTYTGECDTGFVYARVEVTVQHQRITGITLLEHKNGRGKPAEVITDKIIAEQKINVDAVSGATSSSVVIKKAVENALTKSGADD